MVKFGEAGRALIPEVGRIAEAEVLRAVIGRIETATIIEDVRAAYAPGEK